MFKSRESNILKKNENSIHEAVFLGDIEKVNKFCKKKLKLEDNSIVDELNKNGLSPMHIAIQNKNDDLVMLLLEYGADPNIPSSTGDFPIHMAVTNNCHKILCNILEEGADINCVNGSGDSPLGIAIQLKHLRCIEILTENGAFLAKSQAIKVSTKSDEAANVKVYLERIVATLNNYCDKNNKSIKSTNFNKEILNATKSYINISTISGRIPKALEERLNTIFDQTIALSADCDFVLTKKQKLNAVRKIIVGISNNLSVWIAKKVDEYVFLINKAESAIEEEIVRNTIISDQLLEESKDIKIIKSMFAENTKINHSLSEYDESCAQSTVLKIADKDRSIDIKMEQILTRKSNHEMELIEFFAIKVHHPRTPVELEHLVQLSQARLQSETNILSKNIKNRAECAEFIEEQLKTPGKNNKNLIANGLAIDKILRPGKANKIHIIVFPENNHDVLVKNACSLAFETGASVYIFKYPDVLEKNDTIHAGISVVNKLLDEGVHPDKIILCSSANNEQTTKNTQIQFANIGVNLSHINISSNSKKHQSYDHRYLSFAQSNAKTASAKTSTNQEAYMKSLNKVFAKILGKPKLTYGNLSECIFKDHLSPLQVINLFIRFSQDLLRSSTSLQNPALPKERVENIVGIVRD